MSGRRRALGQGTGTYVTSAVPMTPLHVSGYNELAAFTPTNPSYTFGMHKAVDGYYYFSGMAIAILLQNRDPFFYKYDPVANKIVQKVKLPIGIASTDSHRLATIASDSSGHIYAVFEKLIAAGTHGTDVFLYKTTVAGDLSTLALLQTFTGRWTYPSIIVDGSNVFICARGGTSTVTFVRGQYWYWRSSNGGTSFGSPVCLYDSSDEDTEVAYCWLQYDYVTSNVHIVLNERNNTLNNWTFVAHVRGTITSDVWTNQAGTFSKNVSSSGALTRTEWFDNCLILNSPNYSTTAVNHEGGVCKTGGAIKILVSVQTLTGNTYIGNPETELDELRWYYWNGSAWTYENVDITGTPTVFYWAYQRWWHVLNNNTTYDEVLFIDSTASNNVYIKRSTDNFATQTDKLILPGNSKWRLGAITVNSANESDRVILLTNTRGDIFEIDAEGREDYSDLLVLFPYEFAKYSS